ncbi:putative inosine-uridine preferring nucleoside hydrolase protein [Neofusicoccum parvum UCRNP2]|uniref:Putative inosine-uridine preferring nucleoside hydrolase protein n=1 Tax=Botryosphaeria parva (strain UCR-NP2) TaxID=1287680 RepID=R1G6R1_BOTPV|nr:putative inosine-uridine preferring nucleoside hydrolase protein [Neofusicoccum parvum UCRNP2]
MPAPKNRIIVDTDPGVDDVLALLLAFSAKPEELEVLLVSLTFGNIDVQNCLRNAVSLFHWIDKEIAWRKENGLPEGFESLRAHKPLVAVGAEEPLADQIILADYFHGIDGLGGIHSSHPHLTPEETWKSLFASSLSSADADTVAAAREAQQPNALFTPSTQRAHLEILRLLRENEPNTITIVAVGPLTNCALAAAEDPETFLRVKEVVVMGGAIEERGNVLKQPPHPTETPPPFNLIKAPDTPLRAALNERNQVTPVAEFNTYADSIAAARVYALTSALPESTLPPTPPTPPGQEDAHLKPYPKNLSKRLRVALFPLDITSKHELTRGQFTAAVSARLAAGSPLATWATAFLASTFRKIETLSSAAGDAAGAETVSLALHDPLCVWYALSADDGSWTWAAGRADREDEDEEAEDIRVETSGQWTRGMCVVDRRPRRLRAADGEAGEVPGDTGNWLGRRAGNRVRRYSTGDQ